MISFFEASLRCTSTYCQGISESSKWKNYSTLSLIFANTIQHTPYKLLCRDESLRTKEPMNDEICDKLRTMINLTEEFQAPIDGIDGLLGDDSKSPLWRFL